MIGKLKGIVEKISENNVLLDVQGVCYLCFCPASSLRALPPEGEAAALWIETHVREDHINLYGFASEAEQSWFKTLTQVNGVGPKLALTVLSGLSPEQMETAILSEDKTVFTTISGIGPKVATRLLNELKDKIPTIGSVVELSVVSGKAEAVPATNHAKMADAVSALSNLGYARSDAYQAVSKVLAKDNEAKLDDLIRSGLKELSA